jgi:Cdc6-like AAA superfamily ATPase
MDIQEKTKFLVQVNQGFWPGAPIDSASLFAGRLDQIKDVVQATIQPGRHVILFGERGVGKTSLAKVILERLAAVGLLTSGTINCDRTDDFSSLWHKVFRELSIALDSRRQPGFRPEVNTPSNEERLSLESCLPQQARPDDVRYVLSTYLQSKSPKTIIVIDEVDTIRDQETKSLLADTIKNLSDHSVSATLVLVGIGDSVDELISEHKSIERSLLQVPIPRMSRDELLQIIDKGLQVAGMTIEETAKIWIAELSQGLPHYTHSLGLYSAIEAIENDRTHIKTVDVMHATRTLVQKPHSILSMYTKATSSPQKQNIYAGVLLACALTKRDDLGYFSPGSVSKPLSVIFGKKYHVPSFARHLTHFCTEKRGPVLEKIGDPRKLRYRFADPMLQPFVIIHGYATGLLNDDLLKQVRSEETKRD